MTNDDAPLAKVRAQHQKISSTRGDWCCYCYGPVRWPCAEAALADDYERLKRQWESAKEQRDHERRHADDLKREAGMLIEGIHNVTAERDALRTRLEAAERDKDSYRLRLGERAAVAEADLARARERIGELERDEDWRRLYQLKDHHDPEATDCSECEELAELCKKLGVENPDAL